MTFSEELEDLFDLARKIPGLKECEHLVIGEDLVLYVASGDLEPTVSAKAAFFTLEYKGDSYEAPNLEMTHHGRSNSGAIEFKPFPDDPRRVNYDSWFDVVRIILEREVAKHQAPASLVVNGHKYKLDE